MGINQVKKEYEFDEKKVDFVYGKDDLWEVYRGKSRDEEKPHLVSIWVCKVSRLKMKMKDKSEAVQQKISSQVEYLWKHFGETETNRKNYVLFIMKRWYTKSEIIFVSEPVRKLPNRKKSVDLFSQKDRFGKENIMRELQFSYLLDGLIHLNNVYKLFHRNVHQSSVLQTVDGGHLKLFGFSFCLKGESYLQNRRDRLLNDMTILSRCRHRPGYLDTSFVSMLEKEKSVKNYKDLDMLMYNMLYVSRMGEVLEEKSQVKGKMEEVIRIMKVIQDGKKIKSFKQFLQDIEKNEEITVDLFLWFINPFLLQKISFENVKWMEYILAIYFRFLHEIGKERFVSLVLPKLQKAFLFLKSGKVALLLLSQLDTFLKLMEDSKGLKEKVVYPFLIGCLERNRSEVQIEVLRKVERAMNGKLVNVPWFVNVYLPKIISLIKITSDGIVKLNSIVSIGKIIGVLSKDEIIENILPVLKHSMRNERSPVTIMTIVGVYARVSRFLPISMISRDILPTILPTLTFSGLDKEKFRRYFKVVRRLLEKVEKERMHMFQSDKEKEANPNPLLEEDPLMQDSLKVQKVQKDEPFDISGIVSNENPYGRREEENSLARFSREQPKPKKSIEENRNEILDLIRKDRQNILEEPPTPPPKKKKYSSKKTKVSNFDFIKIDSKKKKVKRKGAVLARRKLDFDIFKDQKNNKKGIPIKKEFKFEDFVKDDKNNKKDQETRIVEDDFVFVMGVGKETNLKKQQITKDQIRKEEIRKEEIRKDEVRKEQMRKEQMRKEQMRKEQMKKEQMKKEQMKKEQMKKEQMKKEQEKRDPLSLPQDEEERVISSFGFVKSIFGKNNFAGMEELPKREKVVEKETQEDDLLDSIMQTTDLDDNALMRIQTKKSLQQKEQEDPFKTEEDPFGNDSPYGKDEDDEFDPLSQIKTDGFGTPAVGASPREERDERKSEFDDLLSKFE